MPLAVIGYDRQLGTFLSFCKATRGTESCLTTCDGPYCLSISLEFIPWVIDESQEWRSSIHNNLASPICRQPSSIVNTSIVQSQAIQIDPGRYEEPTSTTSSTVCRTVSYVGTWTVRDEHGPYLCVISPSLQPSHYISPRPCAYPCPLLEMNCEPQEQPADVNRYDVPMCIGMIYGIGASTFSPTARTRMPTPRGSHSTSPVVRANAISGRFKLLSTKRMCVQSVSCMGAPGLC